MSKAALVKRAIRSGDDLIRAMMRGKATLPALGTTAAAAGGCCCTPEADVQPTIKGNP